MSSTMVARVLEQFAVRHAAGANRFAGAATKTEINMPHSGVAQRQPTVLNRAHEVNAAARRIVFVAGLQISRAGRQTQSAMDARERLVVVKEAFDGAAGAGRAGGGFGGVHGDSSGKMCFGSKAAFTRRVNSMGRPSLGGIASPRR